MKIASGVTDQYIYFVAVDSSDHVTRLTGLSSFTVYRTRNNGTATAMTTPTVVELSAANMPGVYSLLLDEDMTIDPGDDTQEMVFHITATGMDPVTRSVELYRPKITIGETLTVAAGVGESSVQSIAANAINAAAIAANALDGKGDWNTVTPPSASANAAAVWDEPTSSHQLDGTFGLAVNPLDAGTAQAGTASSITLDAGSASTTANIYNGAVIRLVGGTGVGQQRVITSYAATTRVATISPNWDVTPDATTKYVVADGRVTADVNNDKTGYAIDTNNDKTGYTVSTNNDKTGYNVASIDSGVITAASIATSALNGKGDWNTVTPPSSAANAAAVWDEPVTSHQADGSFGLAVNPLDAGTAQAGGATSITLDAGSASTTANIYNGALIKLVGGTGAGQQRIITAYAATTRVATVSPAWEVNPDATTKYVVIGGRSMVDVSNDKTGFNVSSIDANVINAASIAAAALDGKGDWLLASSAPANFNLLAIDGSGQVTVGTNNDKTGYSISGTKQTLDALNDIAAAQVKTEIENTLKDHGLVIHRSAIESVTNQTTFVIPATADALDDNAYVNGQAVFIDQTDANQISVRNVSGYTASTRTVTIDAAPDFVIAAGDILCILPKTLAVDVSGNVSLPANGITSSELDATAIAEIADGVWDEDIVAAHSTGDTAGLIVSELTKRAITFNTDVADGSVIGQLVDDGTEVFDRTTDSLQAVRDRGDAAWLTGGGGSITEILNIQPLIPFSIDLANTATWRIGMMLINSVDDLPTTVEISPGTISIDRKAIGDTAWTSVVTDAACSELNGLVYFDEVFDATSSYAEGDSIRITFKSQKITVSANDFEVSDANGRTFYTSIRQTMRGTDGANTTTPPTASQIAAAVLEEPVDTHQGVATSLAEHINEIQVDTNSLNDTKIPDVLSLANIKSQSSTALSDIFLDQIFAAAYNPTSKPGNASAYLNILVEDDLGVPRFTANALELAPTGGGGTNPFELVTGTLGSSGNTTTSLNLSGLTYGDNELNDYLLVIQDVSTGEKHARWINTWTSATTAATVDVLPFTPQASTDTYVILGVRKGIKVEQLVANSIDSTAIADNALTSAKIAAAALTTAKFASGAIDNTVFADGTITNAKFALDAITASVIATDAITASKIQNGAITNAKLATGAISSATLAADAITAAAIAADAIGASELAADAVSEIHAAFNDLDSTQVQTAVNAALVALGLDHLVSVADDGSTVTTNSLIAKLAAADGIWTSFVNSTDALQAIRDRGDTAWTGDTAAAIADAVWDELLTNHVISGSAGERVGRVPNAAPGSSGGLPTVDASNQVAGIQGTKNQLDDLNDLDAATVVTNVLNTALTEGYAAKGAIPTLAQAVLMVLQSIVDVDAAGTTITVRKRDGVTAAFTMAVDSATNTTDVSQAT